MRIRSIKPEFWRSDDVAALDWHTRLVFIGLWSYVDDNGVGRDNERLITNDLFPQEEDPRATLATVSRSLASLAEASLITRYTVDGKPLLHVTTWATHQRIDKPGKKRYEPPTSADAVIRVDLATSSRDPIEPSTPGAGSREQWSSGTGSSGGGEKDAASGVVTHPPRRDVEAACTRLADRIEENGSRRPVITKAWRDEARRLIDLDKRPPEQIVHLIDWCQQDSFWKSNVMSMPTFRDKYDKLRLQAEAAAKPKRSGPSPTERVQDIFDIGRQVQIEDEAFPTLAIGSAQ